MNTDPPNPNPNGMEQPAHRMNTDQKTIEYLKTLKPGDRVIETDQSGTTGWLGTVYISTNEMTKGSTCVLWDALPGETDQIGTSVTFGTRRINDIPHLQKIADEIQQNGKIHTPKGKTNNLGEYVRQVLNWARKNGHEVLWLKDTENTALHHSHILLHAVKEYFQSVGILAYFDHGATFGDAEPKDFLQVGKGLQDQFIHLWADDDTILLSWFTNQEPRDHFEPWDMNQPESLPKLAAKVKEIRDSRTSAKHSNRTQ
jgi:hypothetical protein